MDINELYGVNENLAKEGARFVKGDEESPDHIVIYIRKSNYKPYESAAAIAFQHERKKARTQEQAIVKFQNDVNPFLVAKHLVTGWDNIGQNGVELEFSVEACKGLFIAYPDLYSDLWVFCQNRENYRDEVTRDIMGK